MSLKAGRYVIATFPPNDHYHSAISFKSSMLTSLSLNLPFRLHNLTQAQTRRRSRSIRIMRTVFLDFPAAQVACMTSTLLETRLRNPEESENKGCRNQTVKTPGIQTSNRAISTDTPNHKQTKPVAMNVSRRFSNTVSHSQPYTLRRMLHS